MADDWRTARLAEICQHSAFGPRFSGELYAADGNVATLRTTDISADGRIEYSTMPLARLDLSKLQQHILQKDDLVVTRSGRVGTTAVFNGFRLPVLPGAFLIRFRLKREIAEPGFYRYFFNSPLGQTLLGSVATGSAQQNINITSLHGLRIPVPPLREQRAIACILGAFDDKIELNRRMNETLEAIARALFKSWFVAFDPVRAKAEGLDPGLPKGLADLFPDSLEDLEAGKIPKGWEVRPLQNVLAELETGGRPKGGVAGYTQGVPSIGAESIVGLGIFDYSKTKYVPLEFFEAMTKGRVRNRDVLLYKDGGRPGEFEPHVTLFGDEFPFDICAINEHVYRLRAKEEFGQNLLFFCLSSDPVMEEMRIKGTGVAIPGLNSTQVKSLATLVPTAPLARAFNAVVDPLVTRVLANCNESRTLAMVRDALLLKLISGELRVKDAEQFVESAVA